MAALATTITVLGAVVLFEPVNGYQVRRELLSWRVDEWADVKPGSVYSMLATLTRRGEVERHDLDDNGRAVAVYTATAQGHQRLAGLLKRALVEVEPLSALTFHVALNLAVLLTRAEAQTCLEQRLASLRSMAAGVEDKLASARTGALMPPHVEDVVELSLRLLATDEAWLVDHLERIGAGAYSFAGEPPSWAPPPDDMAWQMAADRERYLKLLGRNRA
jgi:DNA-binding PadR family transcriptional regulator